MKCRGYMNHEKGGGDMNHVRKRVHESRRERVHESRVRGKGNAVNQ